MHRNVTALYRSHASAELARRALIDAGLSLTDIRIVPRRSPALDVSGFVALAEMRGDLDGLDLPQTDLADYEARIQDGDSLVSVAVSVDRVAEVETVMRRPETFAFGGSTRRLASPLRRVRPDAREAVEAPDRAEKRDDPRSITEQQATMAG